MFIMPKNQLLYCSFNLYFIVIINCDLYYWFLGHILRYSVITPNSCWGVIFNARDLNRLSAAYKVAGLTLVLFLYLPDIFRNYFVKIK